MMKRAVWGSVLVVIFAAALWAGTTSEAIATDVKFPGVYSTAGEIVPGLVFRGLALFNDDGTLILTNIAEFGDPALGGRLATEWYGAWEKTGPRSLTATYYFYRADPTTGLVIGVTKGTSFAEWDKSGDAGTATYIAELFPCPGGPLTCPEPADLPVLSAQSPQALTGSFTFRRLPAY